MKYLTLATAFIMVMLVSLVGVNAIPPDTGIVVTLDEQAFPATVYMGKTYGFHAHAVDGTGNPVVYHACTLEINNGDYHLQTLDYSHDCAKDKDTVPDDCYYTTGGRGDITIPVYIDPILYTSGDTFTFKMYCDAATVSDTAIIAGYSEKLINGGYPDGCNVNAVLIGDGTNSTVDSFDENPNKLDVLNVDYSLTSFNTLCINEKVSYKVFRDVNGTMVNHKTVTETTTDLNGGGVIQLEIDGSYFVGGDYQLVVMADDRQDDVNFTVAKMRPLMESYETADWTIENMSGIMMWLVLIVALIFALLLLRGVMR